MRFIFEYTAQLFQTAFPPLVAEVRVGNKKKIYRKETNREDVYSRE